MQRRLASKLHAINVMHIAGAYFTMAKTNDNKKKVYVKPHTKEDGTKIKRHYRSTPNK